MTIVRRPCERHPFRSTGRGKRFATERMRRRSFRQRQEGGGLRLCRGGSATPRDRASWKYSRISGLGLGGAGLWVTGKFPLSETGGSSLSVCTSFGPGGHRQRPAGTRRQDPGTGSSPDPVRDGKRVVQSRAAPPPPSSPLVGPGPGRRPGHVADSPEPDLQKKDPLEFQCVSLCQSVVRWLEPVVELAYRRQGIAGSRL